MAFEGPWDPDVTGRRGPACTRLDDEFAERERRKCVVAAPLTALRIRPEATAMQGKNLGDQLGCVRCGEARPPFSYKANVGDHRIGRHLWAYCFTCAAAQYRMLPGHSLKQQQRFFEHHRMQPWDLRGLTEGQRLLIFNQCVPLSVTTESDFQKACAWRDTLQDGYLEEMALQLVANINAMTPGRQDEASSMQTVNAKPAQTKPAQTKPAKGKQASCPSATHQPAASRPTICSHPAASHTATPDMTDCSPP
jgi:hypothetical protein